MFDTDGNQEIDLEEFKVLEDIFSQSATNALRKVTLSFFFITVDSRNKGFFEPKVFPKREIPVFPFPSGEEIKFGKTDSHKVQVIIRQSC